MTKEKKCYVKSYRIIMDLWNESKLFLILLFWEWLDDLDFFIRPLSDHPHIQNEKLRREYDGQ